MEKKAIHQGRNVRRFREMLGLKQEALAYELGEEWNQKRVSTMEQKEQIQEDILEQVAAVLKVPVEAIKNFDEERAIFNIQNNYDNANQNVNYQFNPVDKLFQVIEENKALYERLLQSEREKVEILQKVLEGR
ncbi:helix-turn-helix domain protein [Leadbetterella byssophila DSM 17132]|uniref:Helix-turn-helix domain protein n=1 Tax=Leadbetterella byssophila (strain DSM 17132 / JCM 16389 / KACC 11308 / NBRC 106382 / 4M15) TaxID=649349 RepID=E4RVK4_LEAB4|nr:helix-turn-helix transcriptional regulator [Leadbetterella byssophila]ADQ17068.1 helix-turn-helix domain protein [Leadbetterella byssophila DSM 17132]